jgi:hypothetical protein
MADEILGPSAVVVDVLVRQLEHRTDVERTTVGHHEMLDRDRETSEPCDWLEPPEDPHECLWRDRADVGGDGPAVGARTNDRDRVPIVCHEHERRIRVDERDRPSGIAIEHPSCT